MLGDTAETGTQPDSAPQLPLKTAASSPVARIWKTGERRADDIDAAHKFIFAPVGINPIDDDGQNLNACGPPRAVVVKPPVMSSNQ
jgi:hypothetical protein